MRKYKPVELPLKHVPMQFVEEHATCPNCESRAAGVIGRLGLRLVSRGERCRVRAHRPTASVHLLYLGKLRGWHTASVTAPPPLLSTVWRGNVAEAAIRGHAAVVDASGAVLGAIGDPEIVVPLRSCVKPIQAFPFVELAADPLGVTSEEVAVSCASHYGEDIHVATVRRLLARVRLDEASLACGPQLPVDPDSARRLLAAGMAPQRIHNNCSGKHAGMLAARGVAGSPASRPWARRSRGFSASASWAHPGVSTDAGFPRTECRCERWPGPSPPASTRRRSGAASKRWPSIRCWLRARAPSTPRCSTTPATPSRARSVVRRCGPGCFGRPPYASP